MQVILLQRVAKLGQMGEVVNVKDGYARNFLLPQGKALRANSGNIASFEAKKAQLEATNLETRKEAEAGALELFDLAGFARSMLGAAAVLLAQKFVDAGIEFVVARRIEFEPDHVHRGDRRLVEKQRRGDWRATDQVARRNGQVIGVFCPHRIDHIHGGIDQQVSAVGGHQGIGCHDAGHKHQRRDNHRDDRLEHVGELFPFLVFFCLNGFLFGNGELFFAFFQIGLNFVLPVLDRHHFTVDRQLHHLGGQEVHQRLQVARRHVFGVEHGVDLTHQLGVAFEHQRKAADGKGVFKERQQRIPRNRPRGHHGDRPGYAILDSVLQAEQIAEQQIVIRLPGCKLRQYLLQGRQAAVQIGNDGYLHRTLLMAG